MPVRFHLDRSCSAANTRETSVLGPNDMRLLRRFLLPPSIVSAALVAVTMPASANPPGLPPEANHPAVKAAAAVCMPDVNKFCAGIVPGGGRIVRCLAANRDAISPDCRASILKAKSELGY